MKAPRPIFAGLCIALFLSTVTGCGESQSQTGKPGGAAAGLDRTVVTRQGAKNP
jgi:hypothetical protein